MRSLLLGVLLVATVGCVGVRRLPLSSPALARSDSVTAQATSVSVSGSFLSQRHDGSSMIVATITVTNGGTDAVVLDVDRATLVIADPAGDPAGIRLAAGPSGLGPSPDVISLKERAGTLTVSAGRTETLWIAFRSREPIPEPDLPRRIVLDVPLGDGAHPLELVLAEPASGRPRWVHPRVDHASYGGLSVLGTPGDEGSFGILRTSSKNVVGDSVILGPSIYLGARGGELRGERERTIACCDLGLSFDLTVAAWRGRDGSFGPYFTYQSVFALERGRHDKATWHGPGVGLQFHSRLLAPISAGALPVRPTPSPLGYSSFTAAYIHLFRRGDPGGSPAMLLLFEHTLPEL